MAAIFISHSSRDNAAAARLSERLGARGYGSLFLDFDPELGIPGGRNWEQELYARLRGAQAVLVLCSPAAMASSWVFAEITHARALGKPVIPLRLESCQLPSILRDVQVIDFTAWSGEAEDRLWRALVEAGLDPRDPQAWQHDRPPYPGLAAFDEADSAVFFGRDDDIRTGLEVLNRIRRFGGAPLVLFLGPSGSGKSSLVRAGILPRLRRNPGWRVLGTVRPRGQALKALAERLSTQTSATDDARRRLADGDPAAFADCLEDCRRSDADDSWAVLVVDQLEELFDPDNPAAAGVIELIREAQARATLRLVLIGVMRSDFLDDFQSHPQLKSLAFQDVPVRPLAPAEFHRVIAGPAELAGIELEPGLTERMVADTASEDALPLLAFALRELWESCATAGRISLEDYDALEGIPGSIRRAADAVLAAARPDATLLEEGLHPAFRRLVRINEAGQYARRVASWDELPACSHELLKRFVAARLLVSGKEEDRLEVAHEALLRVWPLLSGWLDQDREFLLWRRRLQGALDDGQGAPALLHDAPLAEAERWYRHRRDDLAAPERDLIEQSLRARDRRQLKKRLAIGALVVLSFLVSFLWANFEQLKRAAVAARTESQRQLAHTQWLSGVDARDDRRDRILAAQHFARSAALYGDTPEGSAALDALAFLGRYNCLRQVIDRVESSSELAVNRDLDRFLSWGDDNSAKLQDSSGRLLATLPHADIRGADFAADGRILTWGGSGIRLWQRDGSPQEPLQPPPDADSPVEGATFSPDGHLVLGWQQNGAVSLWGADSHERVARYSHDGEVLKALFSTDGTGAISWGQDKTLQMARLAGDQPVASKPHPEAVYRASVSPDGDQALSWDAAGDIRLWDWHSPEPRRTFSATDGGPFLGAVFLGMAPQLLLWNRDGQLQIRDASTGQLQSKIEHGTPLSDLTVSTAGDRIATWDNSGQIRVWRTDGTPLRRLRHSDAIIGARFSRDGQRLLSWSSDRSAQLWDIPSGEPVGYAMRHEQAPVDARFSPDETRIASWSDEGPVRIWGYAPPASQFTRLAHSADLLDVRGSSTPPVLHSLTVDGRVHDWRPDGQAIGPPLKLPGFTEATQYARLAAGGREVLGWNATGVHLWPLEGDDTPLEITAAGLEGAQLSRNGLVLFGWADDGFARFWHLTAGATPERLPHGESVRKASLDNSGQHAVTLDYSFEVRLWDLTRSQAISPAPFEHGLADQVGISGDGRRALATSDAGELRVLDMATGSVLSRHDLDNPIGTAHFSPDGQRLAAGDATGRIQQWSIDGTAIGQPIEHLDPDTGTALQGIAYSDDGQRLISWDQYGVRVWDSATGQSVTPRLRHTERIVGVRDWGLATPVVLAWGMRSLSLWPLPRPADDLARRQDLLTGTELSDSNEFGLLSSERWRALQAGTDTAGCHY